MHRWYAAIGGPLGLIVAGFAIAGWTSRIGWLLVLAGVVLGVIAFAARLRRRGETSDEAPAPLPEHRPDLRIIELKFTGGSSGRIDFSAYVANYGTQQCRATFRASVNGEAVECSPEYHDLVPNVQEPKRVAISVPRPRLGNLVHALNNEPTLYGKTLRFEAVSGSVRAEEPWTEKLYDPETNRVRYEIQQREWRIGRGEATEADHRADRQAEVMRRHDERHER